METVPMGLPKANVVLLLLFFLFLTHQPTFAAKQPYIVYMGAHSHKEEVSEFDLQQVTENHYEILASYLGRKLIGARFFNKAYLAALFTNNVTNITVINSPRDYDGHESHTLSTAGASVIEGANVFGFGKGVAKGGSPRARVVAYKICWPPINGNECYDADIVAAIDAAIGDGVDVISASIGGEPAPFFNDSLSIGSFHATMKGIVLVCSAGNSGPTVGSVSNLSPWIYTVGASTMDREFTNLVFLGNV